MNTIEIVVLSPGEVHEALNEYVRKHLGKMSGRIEFAATPRLTLGESLLNSLGARIEVHAPPTTKA